MTEGDVGEVRQRSGRPVAANAIAADLRLHRNVLLHLGVPVRRPLGGDGEGHHPHARLDSRVAQVLAGVHDLPERAGEGDLVPLEEREHRVELAVGELCLGSVLSESLHLPADVDLAAVDVLPDELPRVAADDQAAAVHHVAGHEVRAPCAAERPLLHHLTRSRTEVPVHHHLGAPHRYPGDRAGIPAHDHRAAGHVVGETPADVALDLDPRAVREPGAEVARRSVDAQCDVARQPNPDVMARVGVDDIDVLPLLTVCPDQAVGLRDGDRR